MNIYPKRILINMKNCIALFNEIIYNVKGL